MQKEIGFLASNSLKGRKPGTPEDAVAASYICDYFKKGRSQVEVAVLDMVYDLAIKFSAGEKLSFREALAKQGIRYGRNLKVTLGIVPDMVSNDNNGLRVDGLRKGGPADGAGILKGDCIISMEGQPVTNIYDYMARLGKLKSGQFASVEIVRDGKKQIMIMQF